MEKQVQTSNVHQQRFGEGERFANKTTQALPERIIPALHMSGFICFLADCCMLLFWNDRLVGCPKICVAMSCSIGFWNTHRMRNELYLISEVA